MSPRWIVQQSWTTFAAGARQFVVQLALLMMWWLPGRRLVVDAEDDRDVLVLRRGADDDLLRAGIDVGARLLGVGEDAGRLEDDVDAEVLPGQRGRILLLEDPDLPPVDDERVVRVARRRPGRLRTSSRA
jgi:hypothetical protein